METRKASCRAKGTEQSCAVGHRRSITVRPRLRMLYAQTYILAIASKGRRRVDNRGIANPKGSSPFPATIQSRAETRGYRISHRLLDRPALSGKSTCAPWTDLRSWIKPVRSERGKKPWDSTAAPRKFLALVLCHQRQMMTAMHFRTRAIDAGQTADAETAPSGRRSTSLAPSCSRATVPAAPIACCIRPSIGSGIEVSLAPSPYIGAEAVFTGPELAPLGWHKTAAGLIRGVNFK